jgi:hypothetical protein
MDELEQAIAVLRERGATEADVAEYTRQFMAQMGTRPDATSALQRERPDASGDWEAIPDGLKTAAGLGASMIPIGGGAMMAGKGLARVAPVAGAVAAEMPLIRNMVRGVRAGRKAYQASKALDKIVPKAEGLMGPEASIASERVALAPRRVQSMEERIAQMTEPVEQSGSVEGFLGNSIDNLAHAGSARGGAGPARPDPLIQQLEEIIAQSSSKAPKQWKPRHAPNARFEMWKNKKK